MAWRYHWCHMDPGGLKSSSALGISGQVWRTVDIVYAQWLLGRTFGHLVGAQHLITLGRPTSQSASSVSLSKAGKVLPAPLNFMTVSWASRATCHDLHTSLAHRKL